ncbi:MAG: hypothetical protein VXX54_06565, partial [Candidatus Thermoplasmatota archaeon]|nr:hypothetical protein [Candidatus Thermoplasmatota archaeon]
GASHSMNVQLVVAEAPTNNPIAWAVKEFGMTTTIIIGVLGVVILGLVSMLVLGRRGGAEELVETKSSSVWDQAPVAATFDAAPAAPLPAPTPAPMAPMPDMNAQPVAAPEPAPVQAGPPLPASGLPPGWTMEQWAFYGEKWLETNAPAVQTPTYAAPQPAAPANLDNLLDGLDL